jgi:hypothetical protein
MAGFPELIMSDPVIAQKAPYALELKVPDTFDSA